MLRRSTLDPMVSKERLKQDVVFSLMLSLDPSHNKLIRHILRGEKLPDLKSVCALIQRELVTLKLVKKKMKHLYNVKDKDNKQGSLRIVSKGNRLRKDI